MSLKSFLASDLVNKHMEKNCEIICPTFNVSLRYSFTFSFKQLMNPVSACMKLQHLNLYMILKTISATSGMTLFVILLRMREVSFLCKRSLTNLQIKAVTSCSKSKLGRGDYRLSVIVSLQRAHFLSGFSLLYCSVMSLAIYSGI